MDDNGKNVKKNEKKIKAGNILPKNNNNIIPLSQKINMDLVKVKWNFDYVIFTYSIDGKTVTARASEYFKDFKNQEKKPKISKVDVLKVTENVTCLLKHYSIKVKYNMFKTDYEVWVKEKKYSFEDHFINIWDKCTKQSFNISKEKLTDSLIYIAKQNKYNPIEEYLIECYQYYLQKPNPKIFTEITNTIKSNSKLKEKYLGRFFLQMIYLACSKEDEQTASQYLLVLQGKQGIGKTTWLQNLLPKKLKSKYFLGGKTLDLTNKDHVIETVSNWLCEIGEISSTFRKSDQEALKNFITAFKDKFRLPYAKTAIEQKRRTTLCGTTNDNEYLKDLTGTRRFLTLNCTEINFNHDVDIDMLWGYMYSLYIKNKPYWFDIKEIDEIINNNNEYLSKPESILIIEDMFELFPSADTDANEDAGEWLKASEIYEILKVNIPNSRAGSQLNKFTIGKELKKMNVKIRYDKRCRVNYFYVRKL